VIELSVTMNSIESDLDCCTGCRICQLACSFKKTGSFNPRKAYIAIEEGDSGTIGVTFTEDCDACCVCVESCVYGTLRRRRRA